MASDPNSLRVPFNPMADLQEVVAEVMVGAAAAGAVAGLREGRLGLADLVGGGAAADLAACSVPPARDANTR